MAFLVQFAALGELLQKRPGVAVIVVAEVPGLFGGGAVHLVIGEPGGGGLGVWQVKPDFVIDKSGREKKLRTKSKTHWRNDERPVARPFTARL